MKLIKTPTKGMNDYLPAEVALREYVKSVIVSSYTADGFCMIETPAVEHIENLTGKNGGENEKLIFKIMKRGEKLANASSEDELCDSGLRYDLTVPLSRYYANNSAKLPSPFLAMQIGNVWRADRPQKGRYRQFTQCDIDILGDATQTAEITLISSTAGVLRKLGFDNFTIRINDRRMLKLCAEACGFAPEEHDKVFIILDKMDKIGLEGVEAELLGNGFAKESVDKYLGLFKGLEEAADGVAYLAEVLKDFLEPDVEQSLQEIIASVKATKSSDFEGCLTIPELSSKLPCLNLVAAAVAAEDMTRWWASSPVRMCRPVVFPLALSVLSCF